MTDAEKIEMLRGACNHVIFHGRVRRAVGAYDAVISSETYELIERALKATEPARAARD